MVVIFSEMHRVTWPKDIVKLGMIISKAWEKHELLWYFSSVFALRRASEMLLLRCFYLQNDKLWLLSMKRVQSLPRNM